MGKRLFVGSLPYDTTDDELQQLFSQAGMVETVNVIKDRYTGQGKGFAFVDMATDEDAKQAIQSLGGTAFKGRTLVVNEARPKEDRPMGGNRFGGNNRGGGFNRNDRHGSGGGGFQRQKRW